MIAARGPPAFLDIHKSFMYPDAKDQTWSYPNKTPSHMVVDKKGVLRAYEFGSFSGLENLLQTPSGATTRDCPYST